MTKELELSKKLAVLGWIFRKGLITEDKSITINEKEAETVRMIFGLYVKGYGAYTIAKEPS